MRVQSGRYLSMAGVTLLDSRSQPQQFRQFAPVRVVVARQDVPDQGVRFHRRLARDVRREPRKFGLDLLERHRACRGGLSERTRAATAVVDAVGAEHRGCAR